MMKYEADMQGTLETAEKTGLQKVATKMLKDDRPIEAIIKYTDLIVEEIQFLPKL